VAEAFGRRHGLGPTVLAACLVLVTACGGGAPPSAGASPSAPPATAPPTTPPTAQPPDTGTVELYPTPKAESTDRPLPTTDTDTDTDTDQSSRTVRVAGPTLDNRYPNFPPFYFSEVGEVECTAFTNDSGGPVTVRDVEIVDQEPAGAPVFEVVQVPPPYTGCGFDSVTYTGGGSCRNAELPSSDDSSDNEQLGCAVGVRFNGTTDYTANLRFALETQCTDTARKPCDTDAVVRLGPTPTEPVIARWTWTFDIKITSCVTASCQNPDGPTPESGGSGQEPPGPPPDTNDASRQPGHPSPATG
jgi:hypothetical protein